MLRLSLTGVQSLMLDNHALPVTVGGLRDSAVEVA
jgi:hypothetical protein